MIRRMLLPVCACLLWWGCASNTDTAGSASETTNGSVTAVVADSLGVPRPQVKAQLVRTDAEGVLSAISDSTGALHFVAVPAGSYRLVLTDSVQGQALLSASVSVGDGEVAALDTLQMLATAVLRVARAELPFVAGARFCLPEAALCHTVDSAEVAAGSMLLPGVPRGTYTQLLYVAGQASSLPLLAEPLVVASDTVDVVPSYAARAALPIGFVTVAWPTDSLLGGFGDTVEVSDRAALIQAVGDSLPRVVRVRGAIATGSDPIKVGSRKTLEGLGADAALVGFGLRIIGSHSVIVRNLTFRDGPDDALSIEEGANHIWVDHNVFTNYGDGLVDTKRGSDFITLSWNVFRDHGGATLVGHSDENGAQDSLKLHVTFHHNWFQRIATGAPRVRYGQVHLFSNFMDSIADNAVVATRYAQVVVEGNFFRSVKVPSRYTMGSSVIGNVEFADNNALVDCGTVQANGSDFVPAGHYVYTKEAATDVPVLVRGSAGVGKLVQLEP